MKPLKNAVLTAMALLCLNSKELKAQKIAFQNLSYVKALEKAKKENKLVFLDVYTTWCGPCKMLEKNVFSKAEVGNFFNKNFICIHIDGDTDEGKFIVSKLKLDAYPSLYFINGDDKLVDKSVGYIEASELMEFASYALHPEKKPINVLKEKYDSGDRSLLTVMKYTQELMKNDLDYKTFAFVYMNSVANPRLLQNDTLLHLFVLASNNLKQQGKMDYFIQNIQQFKKVYGEDTINEYLIMMVDNELKKWEHSNSKAIIEKDIYHFCKATMDKSYYEEVQNQLKSIFTQQ
jgi:thiol-disulfide isomerase/thioredoxin